MYILGTENGLMLLDRSGQGKVYQLISRRRFQQMEVCKKKISKIISKIIILGFFSGSGGPEYSCHNQRKKEPGSSLLLVLVKVKDSTH